MWFIFGAAGFDALDGRLARMGGRESLFGAEFDSLADVVSFGVGKECPTLRLRSGQAPHGSRFAATRLDFH